MSPPLTGIEQLDLLLIVGSPRSGTTWLQAMVTAHPEVASTVELTLFNRYTAPLLEAWDREKSHLEAGHWHQGLPFLWTEEEFCSFLRTFLMDVYGRVLDRKKGATVVLDKHPGYSLFVADIVRLVPGARFIHLLRDGRDVAVSTMAARRDLGYGAPGIREAAEGWKRHVRGAREAGSRGSRYLELRYEDLLDDPAGKLREVFAFAELSVDAVMVDRIAREHSFDEMRRRRQHVEPSVNLPAAFYRKGRAGSWQDEMSALDRLIFARSAGDLLDELGYASGRWWRASPFEVALEPLAWLLDRRSVRVLRRRLRRRA